LFSFSFELSKQHNMYEFILTEFSSQFCFTWCFWAVCAPKICRVVALQTRPGYWRTLYTSTLNFTKCVVLVVYIQSAYSAIKALSTDTSFLVCVVVCRNVRRILVRGSVPPCRLRRRKFDYEMVHSEVYLNKHVVSIAPFSTPACPDCSQNIT